jgi:lipopolysaccharide heptosyltransferase II
MNVRFLKWFDSFIGHLITVCLTQPQAKPVIVAKSILLIRPGGIGDAVLLIPCIQAIRNRYPSVKITVLAERRNGAVFGLCPDIDKLLMYDHSAELLKTLRDNYDVVIDTEQWHRLSAVVARMTRAPLLIGYATNERSRLFTHSVPYSHDDYEVDSFLGLLEPLKIEPKKKLNRFLTVPDDAAQKAALLLNPLAGKRFVVFFPGASIPERRWGADRFKHVAEQLAVTGIDVVVVGGKDDRELGDVITFGGLGLNLACLTSLPETAAVIDKSALLLSGDSGVLHLAVGLGKPTVSLFGPGRAKKWAPRGDRNIVIDKGLPCSPCTTFGTTPTCPIGAKCMKDITVDEVFNSVMMLLIEKR